MRGAEVYFDAGGRVVAPGADGVEVVFELLVLQFGLDVCAAELGCGVSVEHLHHHQADAE
jgi:hypothetical protein